MTVVDEVSGDVESFAQAVLRRPLWAHQLDLARSTARYRVICAGRQCGKSTGLAVIALHEAATRRNVLVLLVSAGEVASRRLLEECAALAAGSPLLRGSVLDESKSQLTLSNNSRILSVPASQRQIRGWPVDLLILDEAGFIDGEIWRAAEPAIVARPGSRVILSSSPWGGVEHFYRVLWRRGMDDPDDQVAAWHWPSTVSPLVDAALLEQIRARESADYFEREYLARWTDEAGAYFTESELSRAVASYALLSPDDVGGRVFRRDRWPAVCGGVDYGVSRDANAVALVGLLEPGQCGDQRWRLFVPWLRAEYGWAWNEFLEYLVDVAHGYRRVRVFASERNGVGSWPTDDLADRMLRARTSTFVLPVWTDGRRKMSGFGKIKALLQAQRLVLPNHPELLKQLRALEFEQLAGGGTRIAVPDRAGHDDLAMALMQAISCAEPRILRDAEVSRFPSPTRARSDDPDEWVSTGGGVRVPRCPVPSPSARWITSPAGPETGDGW